LQKDHVNLNAHAQIRTSQISLALGASALVIALTMSAFYISDTATGNGNLRNVLATLGFCEKADESPNNQISKPAPTETPESTGPTQDNEILSSESASRDGATGTAGRDGQAGSAGAAGTDGTTGAAGVPGAVGATGSSGPAGPCTYLLDLALIDGNLVPSRDNFYTLGSSQFRWKDLQLGPGTLFIEDPETGNQVAITVNDGSLLLDGADSLRIGNIRLTAAGIESILSDQDITIGNLGDTGYVVLARGLKFPDGTIQSTAGGVGATGPQGPEGPQGPQGEPGSIGEFKEEKSCVELPREETPASERPELMGHILLGTCEQNRVKGTDIVLLLRVP
jgi:hypothetical protein